ncbi:MAG: hypothetical protein Q8830_00675 [Candidatus Phytoplasma australasiaticum]|nr:hypothetical protein [Candidatus Phytoplasma australasiaticum]
MFYVKKNFLKLNYLFYGIINNKIIIFLTILKLLFKLISVFPDRGLFFHFYLLFLLLFFN